MHFHRMPIEAESPEELGYGNIRCNLAESSVRDIYFKDLDIDLSELLLCYGPHRGDILLRQSIIQNEPGLTEEDVLVTPGAAGALFLLAATLLDSSSHLIVTRPNYATNIETPRTINCAMSIVDLKFEDGYQLNVEDVRAAIRPNTKLISVTTPNNPTGVRIPQETLHELANLAEESNCYLLVDETYRELSLDGKTFPYAASIHPKVISVASLSKAFGVPGIRTGWLICRDKNLIEKLLAAKEQIFICGSVLDEAVATHILQKKDHFLQKYWPMVISNWKYLQDWMGRQHYLEWIKPEAGVVCFPRIKPGVNIDTSKFYKELYEKYGTIVGPGHWFEQPDRYMRIGFGYPGEEEFREGLKCVLNTMTA